jgi:gamma-glutamyltranspeptidase/glutathione hydrolase
MIRRASPSRQPSSALRARAAIACVAALAGIGTVDGASREPVRARQGMVASADAHASRVGVDVLRAGGNAVDAAVAVGFALAVTYPSAGNIGGGGFMVIRLADGRETTIDYRETAPAAAHRDMFLDEAGSPVSERSIVGPLAAGVPGSVAGLALAHRKYGRLPLATVVAPAIRLARDGFEISWHMAALLASGQSLLARFPSTARTFLRPDGTPLTAGERLVQPDLAATLQDIAEHGPDAFYRGRIAGLIAAEM